jgi:NADPH:quinone reductase-like Zn-dependent oxidoreductase
VAGLSAGSTATSARTPSSWCCRPPTWPSCPDGLDLVEAATVPLNALTALQLVDILGDGEGRSLLVTGAAGASAATSSRSRWSAAGG